MAPPFPIAHCTADNQVRSSTMLKEIKIKKILVRPWHHRSQSHTALLITRQARLPIADRVRRRAGAGGRAGGEGGGRERGRERERRERERERGRERERQRERQRHRETEKREKDRERRVRIARFVF